MAKSVTKEELSALASELQTKSKEVEQIRDRFNQALSIKHQLSLRIASAIHQIDKLNENNTSSFINLNDGIVSSMKNTAAHEKRLIVISKSGIVSAQQSLDSAIKVGRRLGMKKEVVSLFENLKNGFKYCERKIPLWEERLKLQDKMIDSRSNKDYGHFKKTLQKEISFEKDVLVKRGDLLSKTRNFFENVMKDPGRAAQNFFLATVGGGFVGALAGGVTGIRGSMDYSGVGPMVAVLTPLFAIGGACIAMSFYFDDFEEKMAKSYALVYGNT